MTGIQELLGRIVAENINPNPKKHGNVEMATSVRIRNQFEL